MAEKDDDNEEGGGDTGEDKRTAFNDTGLHLLKGAIVSVLGPRAAVTAGVRFSTAMKATLTIEYTAGGKPTEEEFARIQNAATEKITQNVAIKEFKMEKSAAEQKYKSTPVNHTYVYDKFPVKAGITELSVLEIADWNVNACPGPHLKTTGELLGLYIQKQKYRKNKNQHEFSFVVGQSAIDGLKAKAEAELKLNNAAKNKLKDGGSANNTAATTATATATANTANADHKTKDKPKDDSKKGGGKGGKGSNNSTAAVVTTSTAAETVIANSNGGAELKLPVGNATFRSVLDETVHELLNSIVIPTVNEHHASVHTAPFTPLRDRRTQTV